MIWKEDQDGHVDWLRFVWPFSTFSRAFDPLSPSDTGKGGKKFNCILMFIIVSAKLQSVDFNAGS